MREEYDFSKGVRGKYAARFANGSSVVLQEQHVDKVLIEPRRQETFDQKIGEGKLDPWSVVMADNRIETIEVNYSDYLDRETGHPQRIYSSVWHGHPHHLGHLDARIEVAVAGAAKAAANVLGTVVREVLRPGQTSTLERLRVAEKVVFALRSKDPSAVTSAMEEYDRLIHVAAR